MIDIQKLSTGQKLHHPAFGVVVIEAVYYQGGEWKADLRFDDNSTYIGETNAMARKWKWELIR